MDEEQRESCGRCAMSSTAGLVDESADPYDGECIEVDERAARLVSPTAWLGRVTDRLDDWATSVTYER